MMIKCIFRMSRIINQMQEIELILFSGFQVRDVKRRLQEAILQFDVTDMLGYDPTKRQVPLTDAKHCAHCALR